MLLTVVILLAAAVVLVSLSRRLGVGSILGYLLAGVLIGPSGLRLVTDVASIANISELGVLMLLFIIGLEAAAAAYLGDAALGVRPWLGADAGHRWGFHGTGAPGRRALDRRRHPGFRSRAVVDGDRPAAAVRAQPSDSRLRAGQFFRAVVPGSGLRPVDRPGADPGRRAQRDAGLAGDSEGRRGGRRDPGRRPLPATAHLQRHRWFAHPRAVHRDRGFWSWRARRRWPGRRACRCRWAPSRPGSYWRNPNTGTSCSRRGAVRGAAPGLLLHVGRHVGQYRPGGAGAGADRRGRDRAGRRQGGDRLRLGRLRGQIHPTAIRFALAIPQGSEFAFVLFGAALGVGALSKPMADQATLIVALSMLLSPVLFALSERWLMPTVIKRTQARPASDVKDVKPAPVVICGFGRFGQVVGRVLLTRGIAFNALDSEPDNVATVRRYGYLAYYGDSTRLELLRAVGAETAKIIVIALPDPAEVLKVAELARKHFPGAKVFARARNRRAAHLLMDQGVTEQVRETFFSSLRLTELVLKGLDFSDAEARRTVATFRERDEQMLIDQHAFYDDEVQLMQTAAQAAEELRGLFEADTSS